VGIFLLGVLAPRGPPGAELFGGGGGGGGGCRG